MINKFKITDAKIVYCIKSAVTKSLFKLYQFVTNLLIKNNLMLT